MKNSFLRTITIGMCAVVTIASLTSCGDSNSIELTGEQAAEVSSGPSAFDDQYFQNRSHDFKYDLRNDGEADDTLNVGIGWEMNSIIFNHEGSTVDADMEALIPSGEITDEIKVYTDKGSVLVRAINVFAEPISLERCVICSVKITDQSGPYSLEKDMTCGERTYDQIYNYYSDHNLYLQNENTLTFKTNEAGISYNEHLKSESTGEYLLPIFAKTSEVDGIFHFDNGILSEISLEVPELLYYELRRNVNQYELEQMTVDDINAMKKQRDSVVEKLKDAFTAANVDANIDPETGFVSMSSDILFDTDSYAIKDSAKEYIDSFLSAYAEVLMSDDIDSTIKSIRFEGHTDTQGDYDYNMDLSLKRANSVLDYAVNESLLSDEQKQELSAIAETEGFSYKYPIFTDNGEVDMDASRRVELNFVLKTEFSEDKKQEPEAASTGEPSKTARGEKVNTNFKNIDREDYENIVDQHLTVGSPVLFAGDYVELYTVKATDAYDRSNEVYTVADPSIGSVFSEEVNALGAKWYDYYYKAEKPGKVRVDVTCPGAAEDGSDIQKYVTIRSYAEDTADLPLSLVPNKESVVINDDNPEENVKFTLCGDYSGEVWAFAYYPGSLFEPGEGDAEWIDPTTLSVDIKLNGFESGENPLCIILTPKDDIDTMLGCLRYKVVKE